MNLVYPYLELNTISPMQLPFVFLWFYERMQRDALQSTFTMKRRYSQSLGLSIRRSLSSSIWVFFCLFAITLKHQLFTEMPALIRRHFFLFFGKNYNFYNIGCLTEK